MDPLKMMGDQSNQTDALLIACADMLEKYVNCFPAEKGCASFSPEDMKKWKEEFYPKLVETGILMDGKFFSPQGENFGIGTDGYFTGYEFFQFIYRTYKALYEHSKLKG